MNNRMPLAHRSHQRAATAWAEGKLADEVMTTYTPPFKESLSEDNNIRGNSTLADYARLRPAFDRKHGSVTAANSTPLTDGAAAVILMTESRAKELGLVPLGYLRSYAFTAIDVWQDMLLGPALVYAAGAGTCGHHNGRSDAFRYARSLCRADACQSPVTWQ